MKTQQNTLSIKINKPLSEVFAFCIIPPNTSRWAPGVVDEKTSEWPARTGTIYRLKNKAGEWTEVAVSAIKENELIEFSKDTYHCKYTFKAIDDQTTELTYHEWIETGELEPFTQDILATLKRVVETE